MAIHLRSADELEKMHRAGLVVHEVLTALRGFVQSIIIPPGDGLLQVTGNLGAMLEAAAGQKMSGPDAVANVGCGGRI